MEINSEDFNRIIDNWIQDLEHYSYIQLCAKPSADSWSLGQLYLHLIKDTGYYIEQIKVCVATNDNEHEEASQQAQTMFSSNAFPDIKFKGDPSNAFLPQPENKEALKSGLLELKQNMQEAYLLILHSSHKGKTKHPSLQYFNATEWSQFAVMHFCHHQKQKKQREEFWEGMGK